MARSLAGAILVVLAVILLNVYSRHGVEGVRMWLASKFLNRPQVAPE